MLLAWLSITVTLVSVGASRYLNNLLIYIYIQREREIYIYIYIDIDIIVCV